MVLSKFNMNTNWFEDTRISSKCITADTLIWTNFGLLKVEEICKNFGVPLLETESETTDFETKGMKFLNESNEWKEVLAITTNGIQEVVTITTIDGNQTTTTLSHPYLNGDDEWVLAKDFKPGDELKRPPYSTIDYGEMFVGQDAWYEPDQAYVMGVMIARGYVDHNATIKFTQPLTQNITELEKYFGAEEWDATQLAPTTTRPLRTPVPSNGKEDIGPNILGLIDAWGYAPGRPENREIPVTIRTNPEAWVHFVAGVIDTCASYDEHSGLTVRVKSYGLLQQIKLMLEHLINIHCTIHSLEIFKGANEFDWVLTISKSDLLKYATLVPSRLGALREESWFGVDEISQSENSLVDPNSVTSVVVQEKLVPTFNFIIEENNAFIVNGFITRNEV